MKIQKFENYNVTKDGDLLWEHAKGFVSYAIDKLSTQNLQMFWSSYLDKYIKEQNLSLDESQKRELINNIKSLCSNLYLNAKEQL